jgi:integrase
VKHSNCSTEKPNEQAIAVARYQHWADLAATAAKLLELPVDHSRVFIDRDWTLVDADPYLSQCLAVHLEAEFPSVSWPRDFDALTRADIKFREILRLVARRRTFLGTCAVCASWSGESDVPAAALQSRDAVEPFLQSRTGTIAKESLVSYRHTLMIFTKHCPQLPTKPEELESYFARFKERRSAAAAYSPIKQLYEFANQRFGFPNTMKLIKRARFKEKEPYSFTLDEAKAVLEACRNDRELGLIHLYLGHGFRLEEACRVNIGDILDGQINVRGKERYEYLPLLPETREILLRLANGRSSKEPLFTSHKGRRLCHKETYNVVKAILRCAGVTEGKDGQRIATHTLRKTFAILATHAGCNDRIVKRLLRHKTADITSLYISMPMDALRDNLERYSPIRLLNGQSKEELHKIFNCSI